MLEPEEATSNVEFEAQFEPSKIEQTVAQVTESGTIEITQAREDTRTEVVELSEVQLMELYREIVGEADG